MVQPYKVRVDGSNNNIRGTAHSPDLQKLTYTISAIPRISFSGDTMYFKPHQKAKVEP